MPRPTTKEGFENSTPSKADLVFEQLSLSRRKCPPGRCAIFQYMFHAGCLWNGHNVILGYTPVQRDLSIGLSDSRRDAWQSPFGIGRSNPGESHAKRAVRDDGDPVFLAMF